MKFEEFERRLKAACPRITIKPSPNPYEISAPHRAVIISLYEFGDGGDINRVEIQVELELIASVHRILNFPEIVAERMQFALQNRTSVKVEIKGTDLKALIPIRLIGA